MLICIVNLKDVLGFSKSNLNMKTISVCVCNTSLRGGRNQENIEINLLFVLF